MHFLVAHYAFLHPELFLDHWGKPVFTLFSAPFAYFGFVGMKIFNVLAAMGTMLLLTNMGGRLAIAKPWSAAGFLILSPGYFLLIFSGLTEPFFGFLLCLAAWLLLLDKWQLSALVISLLPFVRPEGLFFIGLFSFYFLLHRKFRFLPWFLFGHLALMLIGWPYFKDPFWVFNRMTNAVSGVYYHPGGDPWHFIRQLFYMLGPIVYGLFIIGLAGVFKQAWKKWPRPFTFQLSILAGSILIFIIAHSIFWYFGIFKSMGLVRVLICIIPLICLLAAQGFQTLLQLANAHPRIRVLLTSLVLLLALVFPFSGNKASINWFDDFRYSADQQLILDLGDTLHSIDPEYRQHIRAYSHPSIPFLFQFDPFLPEISRTVHPSALTALPDGSLIIWDNWYSVTENQTEAADLESLGFIQIGNFSDGRFEFLVYQK